jgi:ribosomal protein S18 acetylase RimI-like enzyme
MNYASEKAICSHLIKCNNDFTPPLSEKVNIIEYTKKLFNKSLRFEAWSEYDLIGLIAAYFNDSKNLVGYITNVSIARDFAGLGIASQLMNICIDYATKNNFREISLEVSKNNPEAIHLYRKFGFIAITNIDNLLLMKLILIKPQ